VLWSGDFGDGRGQVDRDPVGASHQGCDPVPVRRAHLELDERQLGILFDRGRERRLGQRGQELERISSVPIAGERAAIAGVGSARDTPFG
jgi:hypothetical protein